MSDNEMETLGSSVDEELKKARIRAAERLKEGGHSNAEIAERLGIDEDAVSSLLEK